MSACTLVSARRPDKSIAKKPARNPIAFHNQLPPAPPSLPRQAAMTEAQRTIDLNFVSRRSISGNPLLDFGAILDPKSGPWPFNAMGNMGLECAIVRGRRRMVDSLLAGSRGSRRKEGSFKRVYTERFYYTFTRRPTVCEPKYRLIFGGARRIFGFASVTTTQPVHNEILHA